jgi:ubiquinone/menaquinone biosynthesis C-methylase UbiE
MPQSLQQFDESYFKTEAYAEVSFNRFSQYWWSNRFYAQLVRRYGPSHGKVFEIGCGLGHLLGWLTNRYQVYGTDINAWALAQAHVNVPQGHFALLSAENLGAFPDGAFQVVVAKHVVEHLQDPGQAIAELSRVLAPGGMLLMSTPNLDSPMRSIKKDNWIGYKDPTHISLLPPAEWIRLLKTGHINPKHIFSDGFWDAPYMPLLPSAFQKLLFGAAGGLQAVLGWGIIPLRMGESMIVIADKQ